MKFLLFTYAIFMFQLSFTQDISNWEGHYVGTLNSENANGKSMTYHMELKINAINDSTFNWIIIYGEDSLRQEREYLLKRSDKENHFIMDEQNSIFLSMDLIQNTFFSVFEVSGNLLHVEYQLTDNQIVFILSSSGDKIETGDTTRSDGEEIPLVLSYTTGAIQHAVLKKVE